MTTHDLYRAIAPLTDERRIDARARARAIVTKDAGEMPQRDGFNNHAQSQYPAWMGRLIIGLCVIVLAAAFLPSAIRLFYIGSSTFAESIPHEASATAAGLSIVLMAETAQVLFSLAAAVMQSSKTAKRLLYLSMFGATILALVGNGQTSLPGHELNPFAWLEALMPPLLVLSTAYILKEQMLLSIAQRHANNVAYGEAVNVWKLANSHPEKHPRYMSALANALRDALKEENLKGAGATARREYMAALDTEAWKRLVKRELMADEWYSDPIEAAAPMAQDAQAAEDDYTAPMMPAAPARQTRTRRGAANADTVSIPSEAVMHEAQTHDFLAPIAASSNGHNGNGSH